jgi:hypothetical protein
MTGEGSGSVTEDSSRATWLPQARSYLPNADPVLARLIDDGVLGGTTEHERRVIRYLSQE